MATVTVPDIAPGDTTSAGETNTFFTDLQTASANIDGENTRSEWCSFAHVTPPVNFTYGPAVFNTDFYNVSSTAAQTINSTVFTQVNMGSPFRITPVSPIVLQPGQVLRMHFDTLVSNITYPAPPAGSVVDNRDCYEFQFWNDLAGGTAFPCKSTYSSTIFPRSAVATPTSYTAAINTRRRNVQRVNHTLCYINDTGAPITYTWLEVRARLVNLTWITNIQINFGNLCILVGRY